MDKKPKISPTHTYLFDDDEIEEFDELSITALIGEVTSSFDVPGARRKTDERSAGRKSPGTDSRANETPTDECDADIVALMRELEEPKHDP